MYFDVMRDTAIGDLQLIVAADGAVLEILFLDPGAHPREHGLQRNREACTPVRAQLEEYFAGQRREFDLSLRPQGTDYQQRVWTHLCQVAYGTTCSYGELAAQVGNTHPRAVGSANGANPIPIVVPCHRVIGADGSLTGYASGLHRKQALLHLEGVMPLQGSLA